MKVAEVSRGDVSRVVTAVGKLEADNPVDVYPPASGTIAALYVQEGDRVEAGDLLASLDQEELKAQAAKARATYLTGAAVGDVLAGQYSGMQALYQGAEYAMQVFGQTQEQLDAVVLNLFDLVPLVVPLLPPDQQEFLKSLIAEQRESYLQAIASRPAMPALSPPAYPSGAAAAGEAMKEASSYDYQKAVYAANHPHLVAPVSGYVVFSAPPSVPGLDFLTEMLGGLGSFLTGMGDLTSLLGGDLSALAGGRAGAELKVGTKVSKDSPVFQIVDLQSMRVKAEVEETDIPKVRVGQRVKVYLDAYPDLSFAGEVVQVGIRAESGSGGTTVFPVIVRLDRTEVPLRLGYNATVDIEVLSREGIISLPLTALFSEEGRDYVYVVEEGKARRREVTVGERSEEWVEILAGLEEGERVVTEGVGLVKEGQRVE
ncbi:efflux RND transporter periplasmic adaptor subunit [Candidatus Solincola tengchongensis]|uniref:efflux RND transporter periplasmic adaptor subunit n=1 Tax=Candidatus Solincola tengchongensis TaxID=2900693 RepID=UPI0033130791